MALWKTPTMRANKCTHCGKPFTGPETPIPGRPLYCPDCIKLMAKLTNMERQLIADEFSIEQEDEKIARQINDVLVKERSGVSENDEKLLTALTERMLTDEKRRKHIIKEILHLQKEKK
jgi:hypothetical protein